MVRQSKIYVIIDATHIRIEGIFVTISSLIFEIVFTLMSYAKLLLIICFITTLLHDQISPLDCIKQGVKKTRVERNAKHK